MRARTDRQTNKHTHRECRGDLIICPMLCYSSGTDNQQHYYYIITISHSTVRSADTDNSNKTLLRSRMSVNVLSKSTNKTQYLRLTVWECPLMLPSTHSHHQTLAIHLYKRTVHNSLSATQWRQSDWVVCYWELALTSTTTGRYKSPKTTTILFRSTLNFFNHGFHRIVSFHWQ